MPIISKQQLDKFINKQNKNKKKKNKLSKKNIRALEFLKQLMSKPLTPEEEAENKKIFQKFDQYKLKIN